MPTPTPRTRPSTGRIVGFAIAAAVTGVLALSAFAAGGGLLWANGERDDDGFLSTDTEQLATSGRAITTGHMDLDMDGAGELLDAVGSGDVKVTADAGGSGTFIGIARTQDVDRYLRDVRRTVVTDYSDWFEPVHHEVAGDRRPAPPGTRSIWVAKTAGQGEQTLTWDARDGDWTAVVMHPDASPSRRRGGHRRRQHALVPALRHRLAGHRRPARRRRRRAARLLGLRGPRAGAPAPPSEQATDGDAGRDEPGRLIPLTGRVPPHAASGGAGAPGDVRAPARSARAGRSGGRRSSRSRGLDVVEAARPEPEVDDDPVEDVRRVVGHDLLDRADARAVRGDDVRPRPERAPRGAVGAAPERVPGAPGGIERRRVRRCAAGEGVHPALEPALLVDQVAEGAADRVVLAVDAVARAVALGGRGVGIAAERAPIGRTPPSADRPPGGRCAAPSIGRTAGRPALDRLSGAW